MPLLILNTFIQNILIMLDLRLFLSSLFVVLCLFSCQKNTNQEVIQLEVENKTVNIDYVPLHENIVSNLTDNNAANERGFNRETHIQKCFRQVANGFTKEVIFETDEHEIWNPTTQMSFVDAMSDILICMEEPLAACGPNSTEYSGTVNTNYFEDDITFGCPQNSGYHLLGFDDFPVASPQEMIELANAIHERFLFWMSNPQVLGIPSSGVSYQICQAHFYWTSGFDCPDAPLAACGSVLCPCSGCDHRAIGFGATLCGCKSDFTIGG